MLQYAVNLAKVTLFHRAWRHMLVKPALGKWRKRDQKFKASLGIQQVSGQPGLHEMMSQNKQKLTFFVPTTQMLNRSPNVVQSGPPWVQTRTHMFGGPCISTILYHRVRTVVTPTAVKDTTVGPLLEI